MASRVAKNRNKTRLGEKQGTVDNDDSGRIPCGCFLLWSQKQTKIVYK